MDKLCKEPRYFLFLRSYAKLTAGNSEIFCVDMLGNNKMKTAKIYSTWSCGRFFSRSFVVPHGEDTIVTDVLARLILCDAFRGVVLCSKS